MEPSARSIAASNRALWGGFLIAAGGRRVLFAADSGYGPHFREIAARLGPVDLALLGTFPLTPEGIDEPVRELAKALRERGVPADRFRAVDVGESVLVRPGGLEPPAS